MKRGTFILVLLHITVILTAQDSTVAPPAWSVNGYVKNLQTLNFSKNLSDQVAGDLLHNRINIRWKPLLGVTAGFEFRNRMLWGEEVRTNPAIKRQLRNDAELMNLSILWVEKNSFLLHTQIDRLWTEYQSGRWIFRAGRQRINWGQTTLWNPNDIFNTYNFLDFDYEERPGTDAVLARFNRNDFSAVSLVWAPGRKAAQSIAAFKYAINKNGYDLQLLGGWYRGQPTLGAGWAGSIQDAGFKGECQYYLAAGDSASQFNLTLEGDYAFKKGWYVNGSLLYNGAGLNLPLADPTQLKFNFSPRNLMPTRWNFAATTAKSFTPIFSGTLTVLYAPGTKLLLLLPGVSYNLATNVDLDWVWQSFFAAGASRLEAVAHRMFLRMKWSF